MVLIFQKKTACLCGLDEFGCKLKKKPFKHLNSQIKWREEIKESRFVNGDKPELTEGRISSNQTVWSIFYVLLFFRAKRKGVISGFSFFGVSHTIVKNLYQL